MYRKRKAEEERRWNEKERGRGVTRKIEGRYKKKKKK